VPLGRRAAATPNIGLQRTAPSGLAAEAGSLGVSMRWRTVVAAFAFLSLVLGTPRDAQASAVIDGTSLLQECQWDLEYYQKQLAGKEQTVGFIGHCVTYFEGFRAAARLAGWSPFCVPDQTSNIELLDAVVRVLNAHRDLEKLTRAQTALTGLREAFPCDLAGGVKK